MPILIPQVMLVFQNLINAYILIKTLGRNKMITPLYPIPSQIMGAHISGLGYFVRQWRANHSHWVNFDGSKGGRGINGKAKGDGLSYLCPIM